MIWKRGEGVTIDLRRPREEPGGLGTAVRALYLLFLSTVSLFAATYVVLTVLMTVHPRELPFRIAIRTWVVSEVHDPSFGVRENDQVASINGIPVSSKMTPDERRELLAALKGVTVAATFTVTRDSESLQFDVTTTHSAWYNIAITLLGTLALPLVLILGFVSLLARPSDKATLLRRQRILRLHLQRNGRRLP